MRHKKRQKKISRELPLRPLDGMEEFTNLIKRQEELILASKRYKKAAAKVRRLLDKERKQTQNGTEDRELLGKLLVAYDEEELAFSLLIEREKKYAWTWHEIKDWQLRAKKDNPAMTGGEK